MKNLDYEVFYERAYGDTWSELDQEEIDKITLAMMNMSIINAKHNEFEIAELFDIPIIPEMPLREQYEQGYISKKEILDLVQEILEKEKK